MEGEMARTPNTEDISAIRACVQKYIDGSARGDADLLAAAFHPDARMFGYFDGNLMAVPIEEFFNVARQSGPAGADYRAEVQSVALEGTAAVATLVEENYLAHDFVDYFSLLEIDGEWKIVNKTFHGRPAGAKG
jgi:hypothetical protein